MDLPNNQPTPHVNVIPKNYPKFRFYDYEKNEFHYTKNSIFFAKHSSGKKIFSPFIFMLDTERTLSAEDLQYITEFTGILDSTPNQTPIYTGDIVRVPGNTMLPDDAPIVVNWVTQTACWNISLFLVNHLQIFVTGNVFQKPKKEGDKFYRAGTVGEAKTNGQMKKDEFDKNVN